MDTARIAVFVAAAEAGSLSRAASRLGQQVSSASRHLAELEDDLGVRLLERTGRGVRLTDAGARFLPRAKELLRALEEARAEARGESRGSASLLRLSAPPELAQRLLPGPLAELTARFPALTVHCLSDVRRVSVLEESYDAAIRLGAPADSELLGRRLGVLTLRVYAPPGHNITRPTELAGREFVRVEGTPARLAASVGGAPFPLALTGRLRVSSLSEAAELAARTGRLVVLPGFTAQPFVSAGRLAPCAPTLTFPPVEVHLLRAPSRRGSAALDALAALVAEALRASEAAASG